MIAPRPLLSLTAGDLMSRTLVLVPQDMSLRSAARLLSQAQVTGAPVVDGAGRCVGVLSATDFLQLAWKGSAPLRPAPEPPFCASWQLFEAEQLPDETVRSIMTPDPVLIRPDLPLGDVARQMLDAHIHRLIVSGADRKPVGIVSSTDVLAAVARTAAALRAGEGMTELPMPVHA